MARMRWRLVPAPALPAAPCDELPGKRVAVIGGQPGVAARVTQALLAAGAVVGGVGQPEPGQVPDCLVDLTLAEEPAGERPGTYQAALRRTLAAIRTCYPVWAAESRAGQIGYLAVTYLGGCMGYRRETITGLPGTQPLGGIWAGLAKTLHREIPNCNARVLDVSPADVAGLPGLVTRELYRWGLFEIGYLDGRRHTLEARRDQAGLPSVSLGPGDTVLVSGGGRGIGYQLSRALAGDFGCRVIVTGREPPPGGTEPWACPDGRLADYERSLWASRATGRPVTEIRAQVEGARRRRQLADNLAAAGREGFRIEYLRCDFTDPGQVSGLLSGLGGVLTGVVHNAGIDTPRRLPRKPDTEFLRTVATKVDGFIELFGAVRDSDLKFFCNVGSLTGRLGGMVGQLDYAAANEGLARLGLWAQGHASFPVMTLCWPTWDRLGMVTNFEAAVRYMPAIGVREGIRRWLAELLAGSSGEIAFVGPPGEALRPLQASAFPATPDLPGFSGLYPRIFHLGTVRENRPHEALSAVVTVGRGWAPVMDDFLVDEAPALPASLLLENAIQAGTWMVPEELPGLLLEEIDQVTVQAAGLRARGDTVSLHRVGVGHYRDGRWQVELRYTDMADGGAEVASMSLAYRPRRPGGEEPDAAAGSWSGDGAPPGDGTPYANGVRPPASAPGARLRWGGLILPLARWQVDERGRHAASVRVAPDADLWTLPVTPATVLPVAALENVLARAASVPGSRDVLRVRRITIADAPDLATRGAGWRIDGEPARGEWRICGLDGAGPALRVHGLSWLTANEGPAATAGPRLTR
jgi:NAD(P)-dependent dehydrogenase (short-subunit alcohol dehydrogenase family)